MFRIKFKTFHVKKGLLFIIEFIIETKRLDFYIHTFIR